MTAIADSIRRERLHLGSGYLRSMKISDLEAIRLVLEGDSVIDWFRLDFTSMEEVELFLRVNGYDIHSAADLRRLSKIQREAVAYLEQNFNHRIPHDFTTGSRTIQDLILLASRSRRRNPEQMAACLLLKIMHTIHHLDGRELLHRCELSESELYSAVERRVELAIQTMRDEDFHIVDYYGSHKDKLSTVTKLLSKKENHAAAIYDKIRFRIITQTKADILSVLFFLGRTICPFNYVIPGGSHNNLIPFANLVGQFPQFAHYADYLRRKTAGQPVQGGSSNPFTSSDYRVINFVSDIPIRVDELLYTPDFAELGRIIFVPVEFQIIDQETYQVNEMGEGSHQRYKRRQMEAVKSRLGIDESQ